MRIMITGAAGFLGSHLAFHHLAKGDEVIGIDDFSTSSQSSNHFDRLNQYSNFKFLKEDIRTLRPLFDSIFENVPTFDVIYNMACPASPPAYQADPLKTFQTAQASTMFSLETARRTGARVVQASTSEIYGDPLTTGHQPETYWGNVNTMGPRSCYDEGKRAAETLCYIYRHQFDVDVGIVRIFNTYGPHMSPNDGRIVTNFLKQIIRGEDLTVYGDGSQTRSLCYVSDLISGLVAMGKFRGGPVSPINLGNDQELSVLTIAYDLIAAARRKGVEVKSQITFKPLPVDDPKQRCPDLTLARGLLGYQPKVDFANGISQTFDYIAAALKGSL